MDPWKVTLKFPDGSNKELELFDVKKDFGGYLKIKRSYFNSLIKTIKISKNYITGKAIEKVLNPEKIDWTYNPWVLIIAKENEKKKPFWFFIKREKDLSGELIAIGPKRFAEYSNTNASEARREIIRIINYIIAYLNKFKCAVLLPNYLK